ncbi:hypothetical protein OKW40_000686 [Paraburkholderia sp. RAU6.4a]|uniref:hypothetical protein n=1 Tax=Paraburkholderia sp. RAU6.4a TaxID=2991067 RepID=UPI003D24FBC1
MPFNQLRRELLDWLNRVRAKPKPVLCFDFHGGRQLVDHLLGGPLPRGWKTENISDRLDARRVAGYFAKHVANITRCTTPALTRARLSEEPTMMTVAELIEILQRRPSSSCRARKAALMA